MYIDAKNSGEWVECVSIKDLGLPKDWIKKSYLGLTATTGQLADNHDVISLASYSDFDVMEVTEAEKDNKKLFETLPTALPEARLTRLENAINDMMIKNSDFDHHVEHEFASVNDHIDNLINKVKTREAQAETRIDNLEELVKKVSECLVRSFFLKKNFFCQRLNELSLCWFPIIGSGRNYGSSFVVFGEPNEISDGTSYQLIGSKS